MADPQASSVCTGQSLGRKEVLAGVWCLVHCLKEEALPGPAEPRLGPYSADLSLLGPSPELLEN